MEIAFVWDREESAIDLGVGFGIPGTTGEYHFPLRDEWMALTCSENPTSDAYTLIRSSNK